MSLLAAQRDCQKTPSLKNVHKNLPHHALKSPKCCSEHKEPGTFWRFSPTFQKLFLKRDFFDSLNGLRYPRVGGMRERRFDGTNFKPRELLENAATPTRRVLA
jgi:hypothetical protein